VTDHRTEAATPKRIQLRRTKGWRKPEGVVSVARPSRWGNPFSVVGASVLGQRWALVRANWGTGVLRWYDVAYSSHSSRASAVDHAIELFRNLTSVSARDYPDRFDRWIAPLRGHDLACWCPLDQHCHADVLLEIANSAVLREAAQ